MKPSLLLLCCLLAGCDPLPRDPGNTLARIERDRVLTIGETRDAAPRPEAARLRAYLAEATGARIAARRGETEDMLARVETGDLDLAIAWFDEKTPWIDRVSLGPPLGVREPSGRRLELRAAARNGENRWIMLMERASRATAPGTAK